MKHSKKVGAVINHDSLFALATELRMTGVGFRVVRGVKQTHESGVATAADSEFDHSSNDMDALRASYTRNLIGLLASARDVTYHLQNAHWTVKGESFQEHHKFFNDAYNLFWEMQDTVAEHIRAYDITARIPNNPDGLRAFSHINITGIEAAVPNQHGIETRFQIHASYYHVFLETLAKQLKDLVTQARQPLVDDIAGDALFSELLGVVKKQMWITRSYEAEGEPSFALQRERTGRAPEQPRVQQTPADPMQRRNVNTDTELHDAALRMKAAGLTRRRDLRSGNMFKYDEHGMLVRRDRKDRSDRNSSPRSHSNGKK